MLFWLSHFLGHYSPDFYFLSSVMVRAILSALTALFVVLLCGPLLIRRLTVLQIGQMIRQDGPQAHLKKSGTPTMGGILIILAIVLSILLWANLNNRFLWTAVIVFITFGFIGCVDDYLKVVKKNSKGLSARWKYACQSLLGLSVATYLYMSAMNGMETHLFIPFFKHLLLPLSLFYIVLAYFVIVGSSNAVNLTDGLDGLALVPVIMIAGALALFAYVTGHPTFSAYLNLLYIPRVQELFVFCGALMGAGLGFLWYNTYPAQIFMGDVGSLSLGAVLGVIAVMVRQELVYFLMSGIFVLETLSVVMQVLYFKWTKGKRIFRMSPLHHHFELKGWPEPRLIIRFWIITAVLVLCGLGTLQLH